MHDLNISANEINDGLKKIEAWARQWKMSFSPDPLKQIQEVIFSRKRNKPHHPDTILNGNPVKKALKNCLGMFLDSKLDFDEQFKGLFDISKLVNLLVLFASPKIFYRDHLFLDYRDIIYNKTSMGPFQQKLESIEYNAALAITGAIRETSREKIYSELSLESLQDRLWYRKLYAFYKISNSMSSKYLSYIIPSNSTSLNIFKRRLLKFVKSLENSVHTCDNPVRNKYFIRVRLRLVTFVTTNLSSAF